MSIRNEYATGNWNYRYALSNKQEHLEPTGMMRRYQMKTKAITRRECLSGLSLAMMIFFGAFTEANGWLQNTPNKFLSRHTFSSLSGLYGTYKEGNDDHSYREVGSCDRFHSMMTTEQPFLALITETDACDTDERIDATVHAIQAAVSTNQVCLVSVRVVRPNDIAAPDFEKRVIQLTQRLMALRTTEQVSFFVVVTSDWIDAAAAAPAHGVHVKEGHRALIPEIRKQFAAIATGIITPPLIGTSAHSVSSAMEAWSLHRPDYLFVGTCYATQSHPGKIDLEGPTLPGQVRRALQEECTQQQEQDQQSRPIVLAIGGIDATNCHEPVCAHGADGVATIRAVLQAVDPADVVSRMCSNMKK